MTNPIISVVSAAMAETEWPVSSVTVTSPLMTASPLVVINWAKMINEDGVCLGNKPTGVGVMIWERAPETIRPVPPMIDTEAAVVEAAWQYGAWDIKRTAVKGYDGPLPPYMAPIETTVRHEGYVTWTWRPMFRAPEVRIRAHGEKDKTLSRWTKGRDTSAPEYTSPPIRPGRQIVIRLGRDRDSQPRRPTKATAKQRGYLGRLLRAAGEDDVLPTDLTMAQASRWIDKLAPDRVRQERQCTVNQWRMIDHLQRRLGISDPIPMQMPYTEAQTRIDKLKGML